MRRQLFGAVSVVALAGLVGLAAGCGGDDDDDDDDIMIAPDATPGPDSPIGGGDGNDDFDDAQDVTLDGAPTSGRIQEPLDHDFFKFEGTEGTWVQVDIEANPNDELTEVDTVIVLYDASRTQIAENDDAVPRINTDSEVIIRLPATGTYYIEVLEFTEWFGEPPEGENTALFDYDVYVRTVNPNAVGVLEDPENGDDLASATDAKFDMGQGVIIGEFNDNTDVDVFRLAIGATMGPLTLSSAVAPDGADGYGSTTSAGDVYVTNASGTQILARIDATTGAFQVSPPINPSTDYLVWIEHPGCPRCCSARTPAGCRHVLPAPHEVRPGRRSHRQLRPLRRTRELTGQTRYVRGVSGRMSDARPGGRTIATWDRQDAGGTPGAMVCAHAGTDLRRTDQRVHPRAAGRGALAVLSAVPAVLSSP